MTEASAGPAREHRADGQAAGRPGRARFVSRPVFLRIGVEAVVSSVAFGLLAGWFLS